MIDNNTNIDSPRHLSTLLKKYFKYILLASIIYFPLFVHLDRLPIRIWDESRLAINAYEMLNNNNFVVTHYDGKPDMWNTKPPLLVWIQVGFMKILGVNELALRLPSALAALATCAVLLILALRYLKSFWFGFIAIMVLITSHGYINVHATRTGDYDSLLTLFTTLSGLLFFLFCEYNNRKHLYLFFVFLTLSVLTKSINGLLFLPGLLIYSIIRGKFIPLIKNKHLYFALLSFVAIIMGYYLLREIQNPGYIAAVQQNELGGRYLEVLENHDHNFWYYINNFKKFQLSTWYFLVPIGLLIGLFCKDIRIKRLTQFSGIMVFTFLLVISLSKTKLEWYDVPLYPFLAVLVAISIYQLFLFLKNREWLTQKLHVNFIPYILLILVFIGPYHKIFKKTFNPKEYPWHVEFYEISYYLKNAVKGEHNLQGKHLLYDGYNAHNQFYINLLNDKGVNFSTKSWTDLREDDIVITHQSKIKQHIDEHYNHEQVSQTGNVITYKIYGPKQ